MFGINKNEIEDPKLHERNKTVVCECFISKRDDNYQVSNDLTSSSGVHFFLPYPLLHLFLKSMGK